MSTNIQYPNKAGLTPLQTDIFVISAHQVQKHLQDTLGFPVETLFTRFDGPASAPASFQGFTNRPQNVAPIGEYSYVRMDVAIKPKDILVNTAPQEYADRILYQFGSDFAFKKQFKDAIQNFQYPEKLERVFYNEEVMRRLAKRGIYKELIEKIIYLRDPRYSNQTDLFYISLSAEKIITDMLSNPNNNPATVDGNWAIIAVAGNSNDSLRWIVEVKRGQDQNNGIGVTYDSIFDPIR